MSEFNPRFTDPPPGAIKSRRVVSGERNGRSYIAIDEAACPHQVGVEGRDEAAVTFLWSTPHDPVPDPEGPDTCVGPHSFGAPRGGTSAHFLEWPPDKILFGSQDPEVARRLTTHRTPTIDFVYIVSGEIWATFDEGETRLVAGDTLVQRGTQHGWSNRSDKPCLMFIVMLDARGGA